VNNAVDHQSFRCLEGNDLANANLTGRGWFNVYQRIDFQKREHTAAADPKPERLSLA
jgi:hypothetical protein